MGNVPKTPRDAGFFRNMRRPSRVDVSGECRWKFSVSRAGGCDALAEPSLPPIQTSSPNDDGEKDADADGVRQAALSANQQCRQDDQFRDNCKSCRPTPSRREKLFPTIAAAGAAATARTLGGASRVRETMSGMGTSISIRPA